jgi:dihydroneopterin aldolase
MPAADGKTCFDDRMMTAPPRALRRVFIRDLRLEARIGAFPHERERAQPVVINIELGAREEPMPPRALADVVCYARLTDEIKRIVAAGHIVLVETLAERIADACFADPRVEHARVRVEKPAAIPEAASVGIEIERERG